ncbi:hypothetical protein F5Y05DRAFT_213055 [Hypoxylon sp. FL0543]|nr:hypothetical protein F5Y05DRAFT_213055 [Hypoxylon sp. FL0543]
MKLWIYSFVLLLLLFLLIFSSLLPFREKSSSDLTRVYRLDWHVLLSILYFHVSPLLRSAHRSHALIFLYGVITEPFFGSWKSATWISRFGLLFERTMHDLHPRGHAFVRFDACSWGGRGHQLTSLFYSSKSPFPEARGTRKFGLRL